MDNFFKLEQITHAALAQYYRWYQVYEVPFTQQTISNQKDILSEEVEIVSQNGITKGKNGLEERLSVYAGWQNAHHVQKTAVQVLDDGSIALEADILYQNIRPDSSKYSYKLHYTTVLEQKEKDLPIFKKIELQPTGIVNEFKFEEAYTENRVKSFMHYWLYLMEIAAAEKFEELLDPNFVLHLSSGGTITDFDSFKDWMHSNATKIKTSTHHYKNLIIKESNPKEIKVSVDFDWKGITVDNQKMIAETHHEWILSNDTENRFAKMKEMRVRAVIPFQVVTDF